MPQIKNYINNFRIANVALLLTLSLIFTLYLAPAPLKYRAGDFVALLMLIASVAVSKPSTSEIAKALRPLMALFALMLYAIFMGFYWHVDGGAGYAENILIGVLPYLAFYWMAKNTDKSRVKGLMLAAFLIPGLIHLGYMYFDIISLILDDKILFVSSSMQGLLEHVKDSPRVGRRYLSVALTHLILGGIFLGVAIDSLKARYAGFSIVAAAFLSLALLDARAAYVSMIGGGVMMLFAPIFRSSIVNLFSLLRKYDWLRFLLTLMIVAVIGLAYNAGKSRWLSLEYSVTVALKDVSSNVESTAPLPFVDSNYWNRPIANIKECYEGKVFRCRVDQSAYLRVAWLLSGISNLMVHPFGIGYSENYMERVFLERTGENKYKKTDSFIVEVMIAFGYVGMFLWVWLWGSVLYAMSAIRKKAGGHDVIIALLAAIIFACVTRSMIDVVSDGLWRYLMALLGIFYGLLHSDRNELAGDSKNA